MMKSRLRASFSQLLTGEHRTITVKAKLKISFSTRSASHIRMLSSSRSGVGSPKWSLRNFSAEDDDFSELGSPVPQVVGSVRKLLTEKPEHYRPKTEPTRKGSSGACLSAESSPSLKDIPSKLSNSMPALCSKLENNNDVIRSNLDYKNARDFKISSSITIENVPPTINLSQLKDATSVFGKISNASIRAKSNHLNFCDVEFESVESSKKAIAVGRITVKSFNLPICSLHVQESVTIRISNVSSETADCAIHSMCTSYGPLEGLVRTKEGVVDVLYGVKDYSEAQSIIFKLNYTVMDDCKWSAHLQPVDLASVRMTGNTNSQSKFGKQISSQFADVKRQICEKKVHIEDLEYLHQALVHLEGHPVTSRKFSDID